MPVLAQIMYRVHIHSSPNNARPRHQSRRQQILAVSLDSASLDVPNLSSIDVNNSMSTTESNTRCKKYKTSAGGRPRSTYLQPKKSGNTHHPGPDRACDKSPDSTSPKRQRASPPQIAIYISTSVHLSWRLKNPAPGFISEVGGGDVCCPCRERGGIAGKIPALRLELLLLSGLGLERMGWT